MNLLHAIHKAEQTGSRLFSDALDSGLTVTQVMLLDALSSEPGASQTRLVELTGIDRSTLADVVKRLQKRGMLARQRDKQDARAYCVKITGEGARVLRQARTVMAKVEARLVEDVPELRLLAKKVAA